MDPVKSTEAVATEPGPNSCVEDVPPPSPLNNFTKEELLDESSQFVHVVHKYRHLNAAEFWCMALQNYEEAYPNICLLGAIYLT